MPQKCSRKLKETEVRISETRVANTARVALRVASYLLTKQVKP